MPSDPDLILVTEAARLLGVSPGMVRVWERCGRLPALKISRGVRLFDRTDVVRLAQDRATAAYLLNPPEPEQEPEKERDAASAVTR